MKKKTNRKKLDEKALKVWSQIVRLPQKCVICGKQQSTLSKVVFQAHHIVSRRYAAGRWSLENGVCLCQGCHFWEKIDPEKFRDMILGAIGRDRFDMCKKKHMHTCKVSEKELELVLLGLKAEWEKRQNNKRLCEQI